MDLSQYAGDETLIQKGKWCQLEDAEYLIAAHYNDRHAKSHEKWTKKLSGELRKNPAAANTRRIIETFADAILLDWRGNVTFGNEPAPYNRANAVKALEGKFFREWVLQQSLDQANFQKEEEAAQMAETKSGAPVASGVGEGPGIPDSTG